MPICRQHVDAPVVRRQCFKQATTCGIALRHNLQREATGPPLQRSHHRPRIESFKIGTVQESIPDWLKRIGDYGRRHAPRGTAASINH